MDVSPSDTAPAWTPDPVTVDHANITALMRDTGTTTVAEAHRWTVDHGDEFWDRVVGDLSIRFDTPPTSMRGRDDPTDPDWLPGASYNIVASCLDHAPQSAAIITPGDTGIELVTVNELRHRVAAFAAGFTAAGFTPGDGIAIVMPMTVEAVVAYLGTIAAGGVVVSVADSFAPDEIRTRLEITKPVAVVTQDRAVRLGRVLPMYDKCVGASAPMAIVVRTDGGVALRDGDMWWDDFVVPGAVFAPVSGPASTHTNILFSSGTTGTPKAIPWTQTTPIKAAMDGRYHHDIHAGDVVAWPTNLGWMMGPWLIYAALLNEATIALYPDAPTDTGFVRFVADAEVTMLGLVPSIVGAWRTTGVLTGAPASLRVISSTGEASNAEDYRWLMESTGVPVIEYCGGTEIGGGYVTATVVEPAVPARFTTPTLGLDFVLLDEDGMSGDTGEVFLVPPSIGLSTELLNRDHHRIYYDGVPAWSRQLRRHGDQMRRDGSGRYQALGRVDDTMNLGGIKVSSADLESALSVVDGIGEVAAIGSPPPGGGPERLVLFVVPDPAVEVTTEEVRTKAQSAIRVRLNPLFKVHDVVFVGSLPRTASQKVMRRTLRAEYDR